MSDSNLNKIRFIINFILAKFINILLSSKIPNSWLVGGHLGNIYDDNSKVIFEYILKNDIKDNVYWILNKGSIAEKQIKNKDKIIYRGSIKNFLYVMNSSRLIVSHSLSDVAPFIYKFKKSYEFKSVYISHGIDGFKKQLINTDYYNRYFDLHIAVSNFEKSIKNKYFNIDEEKIKITGFPRLDMLHNIKTKSNKILLMLTWRDESYFDGKVFKDTKYYKAIEKILNNKELNYILEINNVNINIAVHSFFHKYTDDLPKSICNRIKFLPIDANIQNEIIESELCITDYSSVVWDFIYSNKAVVLYHFDLKEYMNIRGSYIDLKNIDNIDIAYEDDELTDYIRYYIKNNFKSKYEQRIFKEQYFKFDDSYNCERVIKEIKKLG